MKTVIPKPKRKLGRPATGRDPVVTMRLPPELAAWVEEWRSQWEALGRSSAIRILIYRGLVASDKLDRKTGRVSEPSWEGKSYKKYVRAEPPPEPEPSSYT